MPTKSLFPIHIIDPTYKDINEYAKDYDYDLRGVPISKWILIINNPFIYLKYYLENYSFLSYLLPVILFLIFYILMNLIESINCLYSTMKITKEWKTFTDKYYRPVSTEHKPKDINFKRSKQSHEQCKEGNSKVTEGQQKEDLIHLVLTCLPNHMRKLLTITTEDDKVSNETNTESIDEKIQLQEIENQDWINEYISRVCVAMKRAAKYQKIKSYPCEEWNSLVCNNEDGNDQNEGHEKNPNSIKEVDSSKMKTQLVDNDHKNDENSEKQKPLLEFHFKGTGELSGTRQQNSLAPISHKKRNKRYQSKQRLMKFNRPLYLTTEQALFKDSRQVPNPYSLLYRQNSYHYYYPRHHKRYKRSEEKIWKSYE
ncbi:unnamed protein product [Schistosoma spindalis]|nr:unnamed protein product [Schistosoma spindale]